jgi:hypothetical protein
MQTFAGFVRNAAGSIHVKVMRNGGISVPKVNLSDFEQRKLVAKTTIKKRMELKQIRNKEIAKRLNRPENTINYRWQHPETFRLEDLWILVSALRLSDQEIIQIVRGKEGA